MHPWGGTISIPRLRAWRLGDLADAFVAEANTLNRLSRQVRAVAVPARVGDKQHESLLAPGETFAGSTTPGGQEVGGKRLVIANPSLVTAADDEDAELFTSERAERLAGDDLRLLVRAFLESAIA